MRMYDVYVYVYTRSTQHSQLERLFNLAIVLAEERSGLGAHLQTGTHPDFSFSKQNPILSLHRHTFLSRVLN